MRKPGEISPTVIVSVGIITLLACVGLIAGGASIFRSSEGTANAEGAQARTPADPTDPQTKNYLNVIEQASSPSHFLKMNKSELTSMINQQVDLETYWTDKKILQGDDLTQAKDILAKQRGLLQQLVKYLDAADNENASLKDSGTPDQIEKIRLQLLENNRAIQSLIYKLPASLTKTLEIAEALIARNTVDGVEGKGVIPHNKNGEKVGAIPIITSKDAADGLIGTTPVVEAAKYLDCAGFITYALTAAGVTLGIENTEGIAQNTTSYTEVSIDSNGDEEIQEEELKQALNNGTLKVGDIIITNINSMKYRHAVMLAKTDYNDPLGVVQSTDANGKNGPQHTSIAERSSRIIGQHVGTEMVIKRPKYK